MNRIRKIKLPLLLALGLAAAALTLSGCLWVGPGPRHHWGGGPVIIKPGYKGGYHRGDRNYHRPYDRRWRDDGRRWSQPRG